MKRCSQCKETKPFAAFANDKTRRDGHDNACRACRSRYWHEVYKDGYNVHRRKPPKPKPLPKRNYIDIPDLGMRFCSTCKMMKPVDDFTVCHERQSGRRRQCKKCRYLHSRVLSWRKLSINMTAAEYESMLAAQGGVCAICKRTDPSGHRLAVDHDHRTGLVRGLLCRRCNQTLGALEDDPMLFMKATHYLASAQIRAADQRKGGVA